MRIDKYLWFVRLARSRSVAQAMAARALIRLNGRRVDRAHVPVRCGDLLTVPLEHGVVAFRVLALPLRRGPAEEAQRCYERLTIGDRDA